MLEDEPRACEATHNRGSSPSGAWCCSAFLTILSHDRKHYPSLQPLLIEHIGLYGAANVGDKPGLLRL
jgi:hypothetical protein